VSGERFDWLGNTFPFTGPGDLIPAHFVLEQIDDNEFEIQGKFFYHRNPNEAPLEVSKATLPNTDFASIPFYLSWFVSRLGRHTPAVLLHDMLVTSSTPSTARVEADLLLRHALDQCHVPPVRGRLMWAGVSFATRCTMGAIAIAGIVLWGLAALAGTVLLGLGISSVSTFAIVLALVGPFFGALLWGRQYWAGLIAGYGVWLIVVPAAASLLGYGTYWLVEEAVRIARRLHPKNRARELPGPPRYKET
jgi:Protein of unknown function (DUF1353)